MGGQEKKKSEKAAASGFLVVSIIAISFCLRAPITVVGPQVSHITEELAVSSSVMGIITTLPLLAFGLFSPFVGKLGEKLGIMRIILYALMAILVGLMIRCADGVTGLFAGTILMGLGIAVGNVMIPSIIKKWFPQRVGTMTSVYTTSMGIFAAAGAGGSLPMSDMLGWGWRGALGIWTALAGLALLLWIVQMKKGMAETNITETTGTLPEHKEDTSIKKNAEGNRAVSTDTNHAKLAGGKRRSVWTSRSAWYITMFMGLQSLLFYSTSSWMPTIVQAHGVSAEGASLLALIFQSMGIVANMATAVIYAKTKRQELLGSAIGLIFLIGLSGLLLSDGQFVFIALLLACAGIVSGGSLSWILTTMGVVGQTAEETAELSGMAQSVGYLLAAAGPLLSGLFFDMTGDWTVTVCFYLLGAAGLTLFGFLVGKRKRIFD